MPSIHVEVKPTFVNSPHFSPVYTGTTFHPSGGNAASARGKAMLLHGTGFAQGYAYVCLSLHLAPSAAQTVTVSESLRAVMQLREIFLPDASPFGE